MLKSLQIYITCQIVFKYMQPKLNNVILQNLVLHFYRTLKRVVTFWQWNKSTTAGNSRQFLPMPGMAMMTRDMVTCAIADLAAAELWPSTLPSESNTSTPFNNSLWKSYEQWSQGAMPQLELTQRCIMKCDQLDQWFYSPGRWCILDLGIKISVGHGSVVISTVLDCCRISVLVAEHCIVSFNS